MGHLDMQPRSDAPPGYWRSVLIALAVGGFIGFGAGSGPDYGNAIFGALIGWAFVMTYYAGRSNEA